MNARVGVIVLCALAFVGCETMPRSSENTQAIAAESDGPPTRAVEPTSKPHHAVPWEVWVGVGVVIAMIVWIELSGVHNRGSSTCNDGTVISYTGPGFDWSACPTLP